MNNFCKLMESEEYNHFRSTVPLKNICVDNSKNEGWKVFDAGPKVITCPLILLPPACGTADIYFKQLMELSTNNYRVISVESPGSYWNVREWCIGFQLLLDHLCIDKIHLFGASLGGFLAQKFAEFSHHQPRVISLFLCNTFIDTEIFELTGVASVFWICPMIFLKRLILPSLTVNSGDRDIILAVDFVADKFNKSVSRTELASRLTLNCVKCRVNPKEIRGVQAVTIMDVFDEYALCSPIREEVYRMYPHAKLAQLKCGGNYPYLSRSDEVNIHLKELRTGIPDTLEEHYKAYRTACS